MRKLITICCFWLFPITIFAQHTEFYTGINGGVLSFRGKSAVKSSFIVMSSVRAGNYTNDLYSRKPGIGIGVDFGMQKITKRRFIYGVATGMELLKNVVPVYNAAGTTGNVAVNGKINIHSHFINIKPAAGYRFQINKKTSLDFTASLEIAVGLANLYEVGTATITGGGNIGVENDRDEIPTDIRPGLQTKLNRKRYSFLVGYWLGQTNYYNGYVGANVEAYSNLFRMGLCYRFNKVKQQP